MHPGTFLNLKYTEMYLNAIKKVNFPLTGTMELYSPATVQPGFLVSFPGADRLAITSTTGRPRSPGIGAGVDLPAAKK